MKKYLFSSILLLLLGASAFVCVKYYSFVFAKTVQGEVIRIERVNTAEAVIASQNTPMAQLFSFAVSIKDTKGVLHTASTEDRQWAVVMAGQCVDARFFPYPPWQFDKGNTYFGARLERLYDCSAK